MQEGLDSGDYAPNPRQDGPDVQDKGLKKYNKIHPVMIGTWSKDSKRQAASFKLVLL